MLLGLAWVVAAYSDYYFLVYVFGMTGVLFADRWLELAAHVNRRTPNVWTKVFGALVVINVGLMALVALTGGLAWQWGPLAVSMRTTFNLRIAFWVLVAAWLLSRWRVSVRLALRAGGAAVAADLRHLLVAAAVFGVAVAPIAIHALRLILAGDYTSQPYFWRSAPAGVDAASFVLGNPLHALTGSLTRRAYAWLGMNPIEGIGWLGLVAPVAVVIGWPILRRLPETRAWRACAVLFGLWALGPLLNVFGTTPGIVLPAAFIRAVPLLSNARIPGRAVVVFSLALSVLLAIWMARRAAAWKPVTLAAVFALLLFDSATAPLAMHRPEAPAIYYRLARETTPGAVLELPFGLRDGLGETGHLDHRTLFYQTVSGRPMLGGFVGRLPGSVKRWYEREPIVSTLLRLSDPSCPPSWVPAPTSPAEAKAAFARLGIRYVVIDRSSASAGLLRYVETTLPLRMTAEDGGRQLFEVK